MASREGCLQQWWQAQTGTGRCLIRKLQRGRILAVQRSDCLQRNRLSLGMRLSSIFTPHHSILVYLCSNPLREAATGSSN